MLDKPLEYAMRIVRRGAFFAASERQAEICILGVGIASISATVEAA
ncbi:MAG TPA: hypothetical protein VEI03_14005 [Stellaceae bacterium]|nr:hypothetical protein [Stellaceae bacterium]